jgi:pimeloyl-ACP methyl ester carboxylesterase
MTRRFVPILVLGLLLAAAPGTRAADKFFDSNGVKIRYTDQGKGEPVLLIHGFGINLDLQWGATGIVKSLAKDYRVIAFDCRGHGKSGKPHDPAKYGQEMVEDAVRLLDHLKIKKAHVVGYSMGAIITARLLATHPERVRSAVLGGAGPARAEGPQMDVTVQLAESLEKGKGIGPLIEALTPAGKPKPSAEQISLINKFILAINDSKALAAVLRNRKGLMVSDEALKANKVPTLALIGADDPLKAGVDAARGRMANLKIIVIPKADHLSTIGRPQFLSELQDFLAAHRAGGKDRAPPPASVGGSP